MGSLNKQPNRGPFVGLSVADTEKKREAALYRIINNELKFIIISFRSFLCVSKGELILIINP